MIIANGITYETTGDYFRNLDRVAAIATKSVSDALMQRRQDEMRYPLLDIRRWSWQTYNSWKQRQTN
jgi:hypothetical protein